MEVRHAQHGRREGGVDHTLALGNSDPDISGAICPSRVHLRIFIIIKG